MLFRSRLLIVGCGDVATRALPLLGNTFRLSALARSAPDVARLRALGVDAAGADLDDPASLATFDFSADCLLHSAPPPGNGEGDSRTVHLAAALAHAGKCGVMVPRHIVYLGTSGVYGDCAGDWVDETRALNPQSARASRRVHAEQVLHQVAAELGASLIVLRVPGIYAADRLPLARLRAGTPVLCDEDDVYTNQDRKSTRLNSSH